MEKDFELIDDCLNCDKTVVSVGIMTNKSEGFFGEGIISKSTYRWTHAGTQNPKCDNDTGRYAASKHHITPPR